MKKRSQINALVCFHVYLCVVFVNARHCSNVSVCPCGKAVMFLHQLVGLFASRMSEKVTYECS